MAPITSGPSVQKEYIPGAELKRTFLGSPGCVRHRKEPEAVFWASGSLYKSTTVASWPVNGRSFSNTSAVFSFRLLVQIQG